MFSLTFKMFSCLRAPSEIFHMRNKKISEEELGKWVLEAYWTNNFNSTIRICIFGLEFGIKELWACNKKHFHLQYRLE